jgi:hypothetical protein
MSTINNVTTALGKDFVKLAGPNNYNSWMKAFLEVAYVNEYTAIYNGDEPILDKPTRPPPPDELLATPPPDNLTSKRTTRSTSAEASSAYNTSEQTPAYSTLLAIYNSDLQEWKDNSKTVRSAVALLRAAVETWVWKRIPEAYRTDPHLAFTNIKKHNKAPDQVIVQRCLRKLDTIKLTDVTSIRDFVVQFEETYDDIHDANGTYPRSQLIDKVNEVLPHQYNNFINHWSITHLGNFDVTEEVWEKYRDLLLQYADAHSDRWTAAKAKDKEVKGKTPNTTRNQNSRGRDSNTGNNKDSCDHCGGWGHTIATCKYVGKPDTPKCTYKDCGKLGHTEDNCNMKARASKESKDPKRKTTNVRDITNNLAITDINDIDFDRIQASANNFGIESTSDTDPACTSLHPCLPNFTNTSQQCEGSLGMSVRGAVHHDSEDTWGSYAADSTMTPAALAAITTAPASMSDLWICDSGAARHLTNDVSLFTKLESCNESIGGCKKGSQLEITGKGDIEILVTSTEGKNTILTLTNVRYAPHARYNLLSLSTLSLSGPRFRITIDEQDMCIYRKDTNTQVAYAKLHINANIYLMRTQRSPTLPIAAAAVDFDDPVWSEHRRLGHLSLDSMRKLLKISDGIKVTDRQIAAKIKDVCPVCYTTRALYKIPRDAANRHYEHFGELVTVDTWGPYPVPGLKGERYALFLIDDATRYTWVELFNTKDKIAGLLTSLLTRLSTAHSKPIIRMRVDNEFKQNAVQVYCNDKGITLESIAPYAHHQVGAAERSHRTVRERASAMMEDFSPSSKMVTAIVNRTEEMLRNATLPEGLWTYAVQEATNKKNRSPSKALKFTKTPYEALYDRRPDLSKDNAWGARVFVTIPLELRTLAISKKLDPRGYVAHFLSAHDEANSWVWHSDKRQVKLVNVARIDNTTGMDDPQPHGHHINDREPRAPIPIPNEQDNSESDSDHAELYDDLAFPALFEDVVDWDFEITGPTEATNLMDRSQACGRCLRSGSKCWQDPDNPDTRCTNCTKRAYTCLPQTQEDQEALEVRRQKNKEGAKERREQREKERFEQHGPKKDRRRKETIQEDGTIVSPFFTQPDNNKSTDGTSSANVGTNLIHNDEDFVPDSQPEPPTDDGPTHPPCQTCLIMSRPCVIPPGDSICQNCKEAERQTCTPSTEIEQDCVAKSCTGCRSKRSALTCNVTPDSACVHCIAKNDTLKCVPKRKYTRPTLPVHQRCYTCQKRKSPHIPHAGMIVAQCDGAHPCNVCEHTGRTCISLADKDNGPCSRCVHLHLACSRGKPCTNCASKGIACGRFAKNDTECEQTYNEGVLDDLEYGTCTCCNDTGRTCNGHPCTQCLSMNLSKYTNRATCVKKVGPTTLLCKERAAYSVETDEDGYQHAVFNPAYEGKRLHAAYHYSGKHGPSDPQENQEDFIDDDIADEDLLALVSYNNHTLSELANITIVEQPDADLLLLEDDLTLHDIPYDMPDDDLDELYHHFAMMAVPASSVRIPRNYKEAMQTPDAKGWHDATYLEFDALRDKGVYKIVPLPQGAKALPSKIVYKAKPTPTGDLAKLKARLVVRGDQQKPGDFGETFSPTARATSIRILLAICALLGWVSAQSDVYVAFLNALLKEKLYVRPPPPIELPSGHVWLLLKSLYGLVQAPRAWYDTLTTKLVQMGFRVSPFDPCVYIHTTKQLIISVHVDDIRIYAATQDIIDHFRDDLSDAFTITSEDPDALYLGMHIEHTPGTVKIHQAEYVRRLLDRFDFHNLPATKTPCDHRVKLRRGDNNAATTHFRKDYLQKFGSLNYLPGMTRVDLAQAASLYGRYNANPTQAHLDGLTRAYSYAAATRNLGITYTQQEPKLTGYCDSDWAGCLDTRRSTTGYMFTLAGGPISWCSAIQKVVALSTCEAEYMALGEAVKEAVWIKNFINNLNVGIHFDNVPIEVHVDNESAIKLAKNPEFHQRSKHIDIRHHFLRDHIRNGSFHIKWISGKENPADMLTKPLDPVKFEAICRNIGLLTSSTTVLSSHHV